MADADLDVIIRQAAKQQNKTLTAAVKTRRERYLALAAKAKDKTGKDRFKQLAKDAMEQGLAAARRLLMSADNAADSYARAMRKALEAIDSAAKQEPKSELKPELKPIAAKPPAKKAPVGKTAKKPGKVATKKKAA